MSSPSMFTAALVLLSWTTSAHAHGSVLAVVTNGKTYPGWNPFTDPYASPTPSRIVRKIPSDGPITDVSDPNLACNAGGETGAPLVADAAAGSTVKFQWTNWLSDHLGPVSTYMTSCDGDCTTFDVKGAKWFKIDAEGYDSGSWASTKLIQMNNTWTSTIPKELAPGSYLMRNEIVALHSTGAPQYYPSCAQVKVSGSGNRQPSASDIIGIPGLYDNVDFPDVWTGGFDSWTPPGPPVVFSGGHGEEGIPGTIPASISATLTTATPPLHTASPPGGASPLSPADRVQCRLVRQPGALARRHVNHRRRHSKE